MTFGERLVYYRTKKNLTQKALAEILNITPTRLNYWEKDKREPDVEMIRRLADALNVSANILIGYKEDTETKKSPAPEGTEDEKPVVSLEQSTHFLVAMGLIREGEQLSDRDIEFLEHLVGLLRAWFAEHKAKNR